ncbi:MAG: excisionase family DNA-binding protein [Chloroflexi bacterium]|nr:excisionase family DNA-binding protein [Chloroflexota bacterium]
MRNDLSPREVAAELGVTVRTVQRWIADGRLPASRVGSRVRVSRSSLSAVSEAPARATAQRHIGSLLVANRGEIARRVARTARHMGIRVVLLRADDEPDPPGADAVATIPGFLDGPAIIAAAREHGADAIHPGYGFLAENAAFARAVTAAGLAWIGPPADAIAAMGDKAAARRLAGSHGVPIVPGYDGDEQDDDALIAAAKEIGLPLLVKPSAGGGGKGMRVVHASDELAEALSGARREARRAFGDDRLVLERFLGGSRHVEIQVLFDRHGNGVHLGERDCSAQRRSQKVVEEAPGPSVTPDLRERMGRAALGAAAAVGYEGAGTVEMLLTDSGEFFFLEMNTRLQVEHPVTEAVTGRDLVADQIRIAEGATLGDIGLGETPPLRGHAIEARIYAEDPEHGFLPATGPLVDVTWPEGVRVDAGVDAGDEVTDRYDPMLAKVIADGATRAEALDRLREALGATMILGVRTNVRFLRWLLDHPVMRDGEVRTDTIAALDLPGPPVADGVHWTAAARALAPATTDPWMDGWRLNAAPVHRLRLGDEERSIELGASPGDLPPARAVADTAHVDVEGQSLTFTLAPPPTIESAVAHAAAEAGGGATLTAPMPGRVIAVRAAEGDTISARQPVIVIEAMKMEHAVVSPIDGTLSRLLTAEGQQVQRGDVLAELAPYDDGDG